MASLDTRGWTYIVDASSWIAIEGHPAQNRILSALVPLIEGGRVRMPPEVWEELKNVSGLLPWLHAYRDELVQNLRSDVQYLLLAGQINHAFPGMAGARGTKEKADPWVIALAKHLDGLAGARVVVCDETTKRRPNRKIPTACRHFGVRCLTLLGMLDKEYPEDGWLD